MSYFVSTKNSPNENENNIPDDFIYSDVKHQNTKLIQLQRELAKEIKVKEGLERFFSMSVGKRLNPRAYTSDFLENSYDMYQDNKVRITLLQKRIDRIYLKEKSNVNEDNEEIRKSKNEIIISNLMYRLRKEVALATGAKNMLKILGEQKKPDLKSTKDALDTHAQAQEKIDLICLALKKYTLKLPAESPKRVSVNTEIQKIQNFSLLKFDRFIGPKSEPQENVAKISTSDSITSQNNEKKFSSLAVSGKLELKLIGCQNLASNFDNLRNNSSLVTFSDFSSIKGKQSKYSLRQTSQNERFSRSYPEVFAALKIDSHTIASTLSKPLSSHCWDENFILYLNNYKELEIEIFSKQTHSMCAFGVIKLAEIADITENKIVQITLDMEPQGLLFLQAKFTDDLIGSHQIKQEKNKRLFHSQDRNTRNGSFTFKNLSLSARSHFPTKSNVENVISSTPLSSIFHRAFSKHNSQLYHYSTIV